MKKNKKLMTLSIFCGFIIGFSSYKKIKKETFRRKIKRRYTDLVLDDSSRLNNFDRIISFGDSQGLSMNENEVCFPELIRRKLDDKKKFMYCHSCYNNRAFDISGWLSNEIKLSDLYNLERYSNDYNLYRMGKNYQFYNLHRFKQNRVFSDLIKEYDNTLVILSAGSNDVFHYTEFDLAEKDVLRTTSAITDLAVTRDKQAEIVCENIILNIRLILELNPNAKILVIGSYAPLNNVAFKKAFSYLVERSFVKATNEFGDNVEFVDMSGVENFVRPKDIHAYPDGIRLAALKVIDAATNLADNVETTEFTEKTNGIYNTYLKNQDDYKNRNLNDEMLLKFRNFLEDALINDANYENYVEAVSYIYVAKAVFDYDNNTFIRYGDFLELKDYFFGKFEDDLMFIEAYTYVLSSMKVSENTYYLRYPNASVKNGILYHKGYIPYAQETICLKLLKNKNDMHRRYEKIKHELMPKGYIKVEK